MIKSQAKKWGVEVPEATTKWFFADPLSPPSRSVMGMYDE